MLHQSLWSQHRTVNQTVKNVVNRSQPVTSTNKPNIEKLCWAASHTTVDHKCYPSSLASCSQDNWLRAQPCVNGHHSNPCFSVTAKLISIDPLREYNVQPLCLCRCLYKQPLPNSEFAYFSNMCNFREADIKTSLYLMSAPTCRRLQWPWYNKTRK